MRQLPRLDSHFVLFAILTTTGVSLIRLSGVAKHIPAFTAAASWITANILLGRILGQAASRRMRQRYNLRMQVSDRLLDAVIALAAFPPSLIIAPSCLEPINGLAHLVSDQPITFSDLLSTTIKIELPLMLLYSLKLYYYSERVPSEQPPLNHREAREGHPGSANV